MSHDGALNSINMLVCGAWLLIHQLIFPRSQPTTTHTQQVVIIIRFSATSMKIPLAIRRKREFNYAARQLNI